MKHTLFHGTQKKNIAKIMKDGFDESKLGNQWYQMSTDFESALFHSSSMEKKPKSVYVMEFSFETNDEFWPGYPNLYPFEEINETSKWVAVNERIPANSVSAVYEVPYDLFMKQKSRGFDKSDIDLIASSKNILKQKNLSNDIEIDI